MPAINNSPVLGGMNVRPLAQSAVKAGFEVVAIDAIGLLCFERRAISILEVNPRNSASMELIEDALGVPLIEWHAAWCRQQSFPMFQERHDQNVFGKAIVYARRNGTLPVKTHWQAKGRRDVPHAGGSVRAGFPKCTVTANGPDQQQCNGHLLTEADQLLNMA